MKRIHQPNSVLLAVLSILTASASIQWGATLAKILFQTIGAAQTSLFRLLFASLFLSLIWKPWRMKVKPSQLKLIFFYGLALGCMNFTFYLSLERIPLGIAVALEFTGPLALTLLSSRKPLDFIWGVLATLGLILISPLGKFNSSDIDTTGIIYALIAGGCWAFYILTGKRAVRELPGQIVTTLGMIVAALVIIPFALIHGISSEPISLKIAVLGVSVALFSSAIPYSLEMVALKNLPTTTFGILMSLEPAIAVLVGFIFLNEYLNLVQMISILLIMIASFGSTLSLQFPSRKRKTHTIEELPQ